MCFIKHTGKLGSCPSAVRTGAAEKIGTRQSLRAVCYTNEQEQCLTDKFLLPSDTAYRAS